MNVARSFGHEEGTTIQRSVGKSIPRKETWEKVTGRTKYINDHAIPGLLHVKMAVSPHAHANIKSIDSSKAIKIPGVKAVITGQYYPMLTGSPLADRPSIAIDKVRYYGEPVALVVAEQEYIAEMAALQIKVEYEPLPVVLSPREALQKNALLVHELLQSTSGTKRRFSRSRERTLRTEQKYARGIWRKDGGIAAKSRSLYRNRTTQRWK
ncbi:Aldehyde oxidase and xanthine dehydrogenase, a/b hammerhead domain [Paenibacillus tianmuensis]|uniref:Aldehyde oxidase and xanthine dehydrogenase, a/b hammerhead domain n=1 Tax=Paenibacillus tianmuensis TaxID=624147 RepID=A0A1G4R7T9_9BACL|nr:hypothetical protein [Paenibacillus tianmuensis]SCW52870.1 Aldehyde oxidase and xanthine dehydrogenase, a/b hammerhead domain [Paenibacillus tianmuensis]